ncbi:hypothetical protein EVAR_81440_1 [Eumeta japonica]|uniref:Uncharacterized protein n=1 Tax=Eumeta variegata TaxID=151549 RepID=A0A4C1W0T3_EUMVA|nr:hypothetical protein EVAR_81440_1 [Eumeta japonica]
MKPGSEHLHPQQGAEDSQRLMRDATCLQSRRRRPLYLATQPGTTLRPTDKSIFLRRCPNAETLSRHESPDCGTKRGGLHVRNNADTTNATYRRVAELKRQA